MLGSKVDIYISHISTLLFRLGAENLPVGAYGRF